MDELLEQFLIEARELVQLASEDLMKLEHDHADVARIDSAFRAVHTLKGSAALFDFVPMGRALHEAENVLGALRDGRLAADRAVIGTLLDCIGVTEEWIGEISRSGKLPDDAQGRGQRLEQALRTSLPAGRDQQVERPADEPTDWLPAVLERHARAVADARALGRRVMVIRYTPDTNCFFLGDDPLALLRSVPELIALHIEPRAPWTTDPFDPFNCNLVLEALSTAPLAEISDVFRLVPDQVAFAEIAAEVADELDVADPARAAGEMVASRVLRVDAARIDAAVDIVGELIIAKNNLAHLASRAAQVDRAFGRALSANQAELDRLIGNLHRAIMGVRMTPLSLTFRRFPRLVREIADRLHKEVIFEVQGDEVEADKTIVDGLFEPLLHLLRNAVDHGIEAPAVRTGLGKPATGRIILDGRREGDHIVVSVHDDGAGVDLEKVRQAARGRHLMSDNALGALDENALAALIFAPGLSTTATITEVSGRGVGMDSVRMGVETLGGRVTLTSTSGAGSTIRLTLPQAVLVTTVITVYVGQERFGVPIEAVAETARVPIARILPIRSGEAFVLRERTIPLLRLSALLGLATTPRSPEGARVVIVHYGGRHVGVEVDAFSERLDVLLRPMTGLLSGMAGLLGAALLGDGRLLMVLDLPELIG